ncbi:hypothetical protein JY535_15250 [Serratia marcescens]|nr:hypothetical protein [Serratia marcescens]MBN5259570.1 hypothetical protein [Serratia marcescens]MBN5354796.1 hypothetical protein [Serratia marcescens]HEJ8043926.1 hypothetical protein [Serratia marcescens]
MDDEKLKEIHYNHIINKILSTPLISPPFLLEKDIVTDFKNRCEHYINAIKKYEDDNDTNINFNLMIKRITRITSGITKCLEEFLSGDIKSAYDAFDETFSADVINRHIQRITIPLNYICNFEKPLFRVRKSDTPLTEREEIFHIPFTKRHNVNAQRYSVAGLPCLYLGTSLYVCWQEMNKPDFDKLYLSSFISDDDKSKILNFSPIMLNNPTAGILEGDELKNSNWSKASYFILWPLILSCSYIKNNDNASFIQEYIIPNLLMQWISRRVSSPIVGIAYYSTRMPNANKTHRSINVVLPPKATYRQTVLQEYCPRLKGLFEFTPPVSWQVLKTLDYQFVGERTPEQVNAAKFLKRKERLSGISNFYEDIVKLYPLTDFYKLEVCIDQLFDYDRIFD